MTYTSMTTPPGNQSTDPNKDGRERNETGNDNENNRREETKIDEPGKNESGVNKREEGVM